MTRLVLLLLAGLLVAPLAEADHVFSHRVYVVGRVLDAEGRPVPMAEVHVTLGNLRTEGPCQGGRPELTNEHGDYVVCRHAHAMPDEPVPVQVVVEGQTARAELDTALRKVAVGVVLDGPAPRHTESGNRSFGRTYHVEGRVFAFSREPVLVEGVPAEGHALSRQVTVRLVASDGATVAASVVRSNEHGDFAADLDVQEIPPASRIVVNTTSLRNETEADALWRRSDVDLVQPREPPALAPAPDAPAAPPGTDAPRVSGPPGWLLLALMGVAAAARRRRS